MHIVKTRINLLSSNLLLIFLINILISCSSCSQHDSSSEIELEEETEALELTKAIPIGSNSWVVNNLTQDNSVVSDSGIHNWTSLDDVIRTYVKTGAGKLNLGFKIKSPETSKIKVTVGSVSKEITISNSTYKTEEVGTFIVPEGYNYIEIQGLEKTGNYIGDINEILFGGPAVSSGITFVPTNNFHFGRRGPSVHMSYEEPEGKNVQWFYNEVTVPEGEDQLGTFFMANGHAEGYFGMQVNSSTERRVLFSIWSAFSTDDPNQIPEDYKVTNLGNGTGVTVQDFGNEGSGIQSFIDVDWKAGITYKFLLKGEPSIGVSGSTDYTGYFYDPEVGDWQLIASLRRPKTDTHLSRLHSFLENFNPSTGYLSRKVNYGNQWAYTTDNTWTEMTNGTFTVDATAANGERLDFEGGTKGNEFFLKNCGFFNANVQPNTAFTRTGFGAAPNIDFTTLEVPKLPDPPAPVTLLDRSTWTISDFSTQEDNGGEGDTGRAADILDDNLETYWHSCWSGCTATAPHYIVIDMGAEIEVEGIRFAQRQTLSRAVKDIEIQISSDNTTWESMGDFALQNVATEQDIDFGAAKTYRYLKVIIKASHDGTDNAAMAEIMGYTK